MAFDGSAWDEAIPDDNSLAADIDDYNRDLRKGVRGRLAHEHVMPSSQSATNAGGFHKFVTFQAQTAAPALVYGTSTQVGALYVDSASKNLTFEDSAGSTYVVAYSGVGVTFVGGTGAIGDILYVTSGGGVAALSAATTNYLLTAQGTTAAPVYAAVNSLIKVESGQAVHGATIPLPTGFAESQCSWVVSMADFSSASGTSNPDGIYFVCEAVSTRAITCTWNAIGAGGSGTGTANYLIIGTK